MSLHFGLFRLPGPCSTPWVGELQPSGFPDLADAFHITISVEKIRNHPNSLLNKFLIFPLYSPWKSLSLPLLKYQHTNHKCTRLNFYQVNTHTSSTQLKKEKITSPLASPYSGSHSPALSSYTKGQFCPILSFYSTSCL